MLLAVLAGGRSRRWAGQDKTASLLGGRPVLAVAVVDAVAALAEAGVHLVGVVVVAPQDHPGRRFVESLAPPVAWTREEPPFAGPVAGLAAALAAALAPPLRAGRPPGVVVALAGDAPFAGTALPRLLAALAGSSAEAAVGLDAEGVHQPLLAVYRTAALASALAGLDRDLDGGLDGASLRALLNRLTVVEVAVSPTEATDLDTPADLDAARRRPEGPDREAT